MMELTFSKCSGQTVCLVTVAFFLPKGHDLKAMVDIQKVFVKSMKNVLTSHAVWQLTCCYSLLYSVTGIGIATEKKPQIDPSVEVRGILLCSMVGSIQFQGVI